jgi:predicted SnoaL-like aldol condensation-catalyzing enzyme
MATKVNEAIVHRFVEEVMNGGNLDAAEDLISPDHVNHDPTAPEVPPGPEGIKQLIGMYRSAFPDIRFETGEMISDGATVAGPSPVRTRGR